MGRGQRIARQHARIDDDVATRRQAVDVLDIGVDDVADLVVGDRDTDRQRHADGAGGRAGNRDRERVGFDAGVVVRGDAHVARGNNGAAVAVDECLDIGANVIFGADPGTGERYTGGTAGADRDRPGQRQRFDTLVGGGVDG